jgi:hypothetical protein
MLMHSSTDLSVANTSESSDDELPTFDSRMYENNSEDEDELPEIALRTCTKCYMSFCPATRALMRLEAFRGIWSSMRKIVFTAYSLCNLLQSGWS